MTLKQYVYKILTTLEQYQNNIGATLEKIAPSLEKQR